MGGLGGGGGLGWAGHGHGPVGAYIARRRARRQVLEATEAELEERGLPVPKRRWSENWPGRKLWQAFLRAAGWGRR